MKHHINGKWVALFVAVLLCGVPVGSRAQVPDAFIENEGEAAAGEDQESLWGLGVTLAVMSPGNDFAKHVDEGIGLGLTGSVGFRDAPALRFRLDFGFMTYGSERLSFPFFDFTERLLLDLVTRNNIMYVVAGPEIRVSSGPVRPFLSAFAGLGYFYTETSLETDYGDNIAPFLETLNFDDAGLAYGVSGGLLIPISESGTSWGIKTEVQYQSHGEREYLIPGSIVEENGRSYITPYSSSVDMLMFHIGLQVGL